MARKEFELGKPINIDEFDVVSTIEDVLSNDATIQGEVVWVNNRYKRVMKIIDDASFNMLTPIIGYGRGDTADQALLRALYTYAMDKPRRYVKPGEYPESSTSPLNISSEPTQLDFVVSDGEFRMFVEPENGFIVSEVDRDYTADGGMFPGASGDVKSSVESMMHGYPFPDNRIRKLPITLLWDYTDE